MVPSLSCRQTLTSCPSKRSSQWLSINLTVLCPKLSQLCIIIMVNKAAATWTTRQSGHLAKIAKADTEKLKQWGYAVWRQADLNDAGFGCGKILILNGGRACGVAQE